VRARVLCRPGAAVVDVARTSAVAATDTVSWAIYRWGWQLTGSEGLNEAYVPFFGAFGALVQRRVDAYWQQLADMSTCPESLAQPRTGVLAAT
jgi:hypothetical protein